MITQSKKEFYIVAYIVIYSKNLLTYNLDIISASSYVIEIEYYILLQILWMDNITIYIISYFNQTNHFTINVKKSNYQGRFYIYSTIKFSYSQYRMTSKF